ncbi:MAG: 2-C-methyl-D-erythritol 4-phosphate cytidylyltransferase, partial [Calditrichia bacterium]|nr:2-C-methyl-D-erythritol 4-phosphate cytidylyltransferase [Calditrichia bacterium]
MITTIITAGGIGKRMGKDRYKQFLEIHGIPILALTIKQFQAHPEIDDIIIVVPRDVVEMTKKEIVEKYRFKKVSKVISGGRERQFSVENAIKALSKETDTIMIHDGVRPFVTQGVISELIKEVKNKKAVIPALKPRETV